MKKGDEVTDTQRAVVCCMANAWNLEAFYVLAQDQQTPERGAWCWASPQSTYMYHGGRLKVSPATFAALLRLGLVEEERRYKWSETTQGDHQQERWAIVYRLTEKGQKLFQQKQEEVSYAG